MGIVEEEADESIYWMELLIESGLIAKERVANLLDEADQIVSIVVSSIKTARGKTRSSGNSQSAIRNPHSEIEGA